MAAFWTAVICTAQGAVVGSQNPTVDAFNVALAGQTYSVAVRPDGKVLVGGLFTGSPGMFAGNLGQLNPDGSVDKSFPPNVPGSVSCLAIQSDGKLVLGGAFTTLGGAVRDHIARLNPDGTLDATFNPGANNSVLTLALQADGKLLVGGGFTILGQQQRNHLARLNPDGSLDPTFRASINSWVNALALQPDGKIVLAGTVTPVVGPSHIGIARLNVDGSLDTNFNAGVNGSINAIALQADGRILIGGGFTRCNEVERSHLARLNPDGSLDATFQLPANLDVNGIALFANGRILIGGAFTTVGPSAHNRLALLFADGTIDPAFSAGADGVVNALAIQEDGKTVVGGAFTTLNGATRTSLGRLNGIAPTTQALTRDPSTVTWLRDGTSPEIWHALFEFSANGNDWMMLGNGSRIPGGWGLSGLTIPDGVILRARGLVGNSYVETAIGPPIIASQPLSQTTNAGATVSFTAAINALRDLHYQWFKDGNLLRGNNIDGTQAATVTITNLLKQDEGEYRAVISNTSGTVTSAVARLTVIDPFILGRLVFDSMALGSPSHLQANVAGTAPILYQWRKNGFPLKGETGPWLTFPSLDPADSGHYDLIARNQFGSFTSAVVNLSLSNVVREASFNPDWIGQIMSLAVQPDRKVLVGGVLRSTNGQFHANYARFAADGTLDPTFHAGPAGWITSIAVQDDGKILIGGTMNQVGGLTRSNLARLNGDGTSDLAFNPGANGSVNAIMLQPDGKILLGGAFTAVANESRQHLARLGPSGALDTAFNAVANGDITCMAITGDSNIVVGGGFTLINGRARPSLARLHVDGTLDEAFDPSVAEGTQYRALALDADGNLLAAGVRYGSGFVQRFKSDGRQGPDFGVGADTLSEPYYATILTLAVQSDGRVVVGGDFKGIYAKDGYRGATSLARVNNDATLDWGFSPQLSGRVTTLAIQSNGSIVVGGSFCCLLGEVTGNPARLKNTEPATQDLRWEGSSLLWMRGGTGPEVWRTTFDQSTDGVTWTPLGAGTRIPGGWRLDHPILPPNSSIRARGYVTGAAWFVESVGVTMNLLRENDGLRLTWPAGFGPLILEETSDVQSPGSWLPVLDPAPVTTDGVSILSLPLPATNTFFRLKGR